MTRRMRNHTINSIQLIKEMDFNIRSITRVVAGSLCSVGLVARIITREIVHNIRVEKWIFIILRRHRYFGMLDKVFLGFM